MFAAVVAFVVFDVVLAVVSLVFVVFNKNNILLWDRIISVSAPRMTA